MKINYTYNFYYQSLIIHNSKFYPSKMQQLISSYDINFSEFRIALHQTGGIVAGSAALSAYLNQEGIDPGFKPNDLDIFIPGIKQNVIDAMGNIIPNQYYIKSLDTMTKFLAPYGYIKNNKFNTIRSESYYNTIQGIQNVTGFTNSNNKEIQVIIINSYNIIDHIFKNFDLSVCVSWYCNITNSFKTLNPELTKRKEMFSLRLETDEKLITKAAIRTEKYIARGFKLINKPCPFINIPDTRIELTNKKFDDIEIIDIFTLDEMPIREYLQKSEWNIVIKAGESYYGFERKDLMNYMKKKSTTVARIGTVCETPYNQCITLEGYYQLQYADYSIYELKSAYSVLFGTKVKSLFHLNCYSIKDWLKGVIGKTIIMPPQTILEPIRRIIQRGEPLSSQFNSDNSNQAELINVSLDNILTAHAHLTVPNTLQAFYRTVIEINYDT